MPISLATGCNLTLNSRSSQFRSSKHAEIISRRIMDLLMTGGSYLHSDLQRRQPKRFVEGGYVLEAAFGALARHHLKFALLSAGRRRILLLQLCQCSRHQFCCMSCHQALAFWCLMLLCRVLVAFFASEARFLRGQQIIMALLVHKTFLCSVAYLCHDLFSHPAGRALQPKRVKGLKLGWPGGRICAMKIRTYTAGTPLAFTKRTCMPRALG